MEYVENVNRLFAGGAPDVTKKARASARRFLNEQLLAHFAGEEQHIFPALLDADLGKKVVQRIADLRKDHKQFVKQINKLDKLIAGPVGPALRKALTGFSVRLQKHAAKENELFPSLI